MAKKRKKKVSKRSKTSKSLPATVLYEKQSQSGTLADDYYDRNRSDNQRFSGSLGDTY